MKILALPGIHFLATRFGWDRLRASAFDAKYVTGAWGSSSNAPQIVLDEVRHHMAPGPLLILGAGCPALVDQLDDYPSTSTVCIDVSNEALYRVISPRPRRLIQGDMTDIVVLTKAETSGPFEGAVFCESLYYVPAWRRKATLQFIGRMLTATGCMVVSAADGNRYAEMFEMIQKNFRVLEERWGNQRVIVFRP